MPSHPHRWALLPFTVLCQTLVAEIPVAEPSCSSLVKFIVLLVLKDKRSVT